MSLNEIDGEDLISSCIHGYILLVARLGLGFSINSILNIYFLEAQVLRKLLYVNKELEGDFNSLSTITAFNLVEKKGFKFNNFFPLP